MAAPTTAKTMVAAASTRSTSTSTLVGSEIDYSTGFSIEKYGPLGLHVVDSHNLSRTQAFRHESKKSRVAAIFSRRTSASTTHREKKAASASAKAFAKKIGRGFKTAGHAIKEALSEQPGDWDLPANHAAALKPRPTKFEDLSREQIFEVANARAKKILQKRALLAELEASGPVNQTLLHSGRESGDGFY